MTATKSHPHDRFSAALCIVLLQGLSCQLVWKSYATETDFLNLRARQGSSSPLFANNFESFNVLLCMFGNVVGFLLYIPLHSILSLDAQVLWPQGMTLAIILATIMLTQIQNLSGNVFMAIILFFQFAIGVTNATITGGVYNMAGWLPKRYIQAMSLGMGLSGILVSLISLFTLLSSGNVGTEVNPSSINTAAFYYFGGVAGMIILAIITYFIFFRLPFVHDHSIPEVVSVWTVTCPLKDTKQQPKLMKTKSASYLRLKTRCSSTNSLSEALEKSLSVEERKTFLSRHANSANDLEAPLLQEIVAPVKEEEEDFDDGSSSGRGRTSAAPSVQSAEEVEEVVKLEFNAVTEDIETHRPLMPTILGGELLTPVLFNPAAEEDEPTIDYTPLARVSMDPFSRTVEWKPVALDDVAEEPEEDLTMSQVVNRMWGWNIVMAVCCATTMAVFPGVTSYICSIRNTARLAPCHPSTPDGRLFGDLFVPLMFVVCNSGDVLGRIMAGLGPWHTKVPPMTLLVAYALIRVPMAILLLFCNVVTAEPWLLPNIIRSDAGSYILGFALCYTGGDLQSLLFAHCPSALPKSAHDRLGPLVNFAVAIGTTSGCLISLICTYSFQRS